MEGGEVALPEQRPPALSLSELPVCALRLSAPDLVTLLQRRAAAHPERLWARFLSSGDVDGPTVSWTWGELDQRARAVAAMLQVRCVPGDRVLLLFPPGLDFAAGWFGCLYAGLIAVPAYPPEPARLDRTLPRLQAIAADAGASAVLTIGMIAGMAEGLGAMAPELAALPWIAADGLPPGAADGWRRPRVQTDDIAFLQYTSGSTGAPKGVMVTHGNVLHNSASIEQGFGNRRDVGRGVSWLPMFHDMGLIGNIAHPVDAGLEVTFLSPIDFLRRPMRWLEAISHFGGTISGGPDFAYGLCARKATDEDIARLDLRSWAQAYTGAEPVRATTLDTFARRFAPAGFDPGALYPTYGLAEATLFVSGGARGQRPRVLDIDPDAVSRGEVRPGDGRRLSVGCGGRRFDTELVIADPATRQRLPTGQIGEIWVRGPSVARGYWNKPARTVETFGAHLSGEAASDTPWLRTGDLGFLEDDGELHISGRCKDLIIIRGRNLYPQDIELAAEAACPGLRPGCVVALGLEAEEGLALVAEVRDPAVAGDEGLVGRLCEAVMEAAGAALRAVVLLRARGLPKTSSGKRQRHAAAALLAEGSAHEDAVLWRWQAAPARTASAESGDDTAAAALCDWMVSWLEAEGAAPAGQIDPSRSLAAQGVDSVQLAALGGELERRLGFQVPGELLFGRSVTQLAERLCTGKRQLSRGEALSLLAEGERADLGALSVLPADIVVAQRPDMPTHPGVLLTGATGFLGGYLLSELLERTHGDVVCLVRAADGAAGLARVQANLARFGLWKDAHAARLRVLPGDLSEPAFGWGEARFARVAAQVQAIYHCGAKVHWAAPLSSLEAANIGGTREALRMAALGGGLPVHLVSSVGVFPIGLSDQASFPEQEPLRDGDRLRIGYFQSKWCAEKLAEQARERGIPVSIYRPGFISGDSRTGAEADSQGQLYCAFLEGCLQLGAAPRVEKVLDLLPVDFVARAIAGISLTAEAAAGRSYNLRNPHPMPQRAYYAQLRRRGYPLREIAYPRWRQAVLELPPSSDNPLVRFQGYYRAVTEQSMRRLEAQMDRAMPIEDTAAVAQLSALGIDCPRFDGALLDRYLDWYRARDLISAPPTARGVSAPAPEQPQTASTLAASFSTSFADMMAAPDTDGERLGRLYDRAKEKQWDAALRIDWRQDLDPESPDDLPDAGIPLYGSPVWAKLSGKERNRVRHHFQAWQLSQYMHGEQGALLAASKLVQQLPGADAKLYAATQVMDEARHLEAFTRLLRDKFELHYGVNRPLEGLLRDVLSDARWDMTCLGMQVLIEGLALAAFATMRQQSTNELMQSVNTAIMEDEARHLAFGRLLLAAHYKTLTDAERDEREEFVVEACYALRDRFRAEEVWERLGLPVAACTTWLDEGGTMRRYRAELFSRVAPTVRAIGLMGPRVERAFADMGVMQFAQAEPLDILAADRLVLSGTPVAAPAALR